MKTCNRKTIVKNKHMVCGDRTDPSEAGQKCGKCSNHCLTPGCGAHDPDVPRHRSSR
jgi:hypothetical protein